MSTKINSAVKMKVKLVIVLVVGVAAISYLLSDNCANKSSISEKQQCWEKLIEDTLKDKGLDTAFNLVDSLYSSEPQFASDCHGFVHLLGEKAYELFSQKQDIKLSSKVTYCGFGFYHAFMEKLLRESGDVNQARAFCDLVGKSAGQNELSRLACFHGIGHGLLEDVPNPYLAGDDQAIIQTPLALCDAIGETFEEKRRCASGVFNVIAIYYANPKSGLQAKEEDPYFICRNLSKLYFQKPCYDQMNTYVLFHLSSGDLLQASKFAESIPEDVFGSAAMHGLAGAYGQSNVGKVSYTQVVQICQNIQARLTSICLEGFLMGLVEGGQPGQEHVEGQKFCESSNLHQDERDVCLNLLTDYFKVINRKNE